MIWKALKIHHSIKVFNCVEYDRSKITLLFLLLYILQYNLSQYLNNNLKRNIDENHFCLTKNTLKNNLESYLRLLYNNTIYVKNLFKTLDMHRSPSIRYLRIIQYKYSSMIWKVISICITVVNLNPFLDCIMWDFFIRKSDVV